MWSGKAPVKRCLQLFPLRIIGGVFQTQGLGSQNEHLVALHPKRRTQGRVISILAEFSTVQLSQVLTPMCERSAMVTYQVSLKTALRVSS